MDVAPFIAAALLAVFAVELVAQYLNVRALDPRLPEDFRDVFDPDQYARSQEYTRARTRFSAASSAYGVALLFAFWGAGGFAWLDGWVRSWGFRPVPAGLLFIGLLSAANELVTLPLDVYSTFVLEQRFGFNRTTPRTFALDRLKGYALAALVGGPVLAALLLFFERAGAAAWLYGWATATAFRFFLQLVAPTWIMPLFNKFTPLPEGELRAAIFDYARSVDFPLANIYAIDGSKRSSKTNAFFTGFGRYKRIALFDTLIAKHSVPELVAVLAHEIGHYKKKHVLTGTLLSVAKDGAVFWLLSVFLSWPGVFEAFGTPPSAAAGLVFFGIVYSPAAFVLSLGTMAFSRRNEYQADRYAVETSDGEAMARALKILAASNLSNLTPHPFYVLLHHTHPPVLERLRAVRRGSASAAAAA
jgi:STE24 endopeptidase